MHVYTKSKYNNLKYKFKNAETIEKNFSQSYQDIFVLTMTNGKKNGYFLEIGAGDSISINNTYLLEKEFAWQGVSIDIEKNSEKSYFNRDKTKFILQDALTIDYDKILNNNFSGNVIDYLQIDIEPQWNSLNCLKLIPFDKWQFSVITFETDLYDPKISKKKSLENREESRDFFKNKGYDLIVGNVCNLSETDPFEDWYVNSNLISKEIINFFESSTEFNKPGENFFY